VSVARLVEGKRIVVCAGPGGVGKTSTSAALGLGLAAAGLRVAVLTIDPAKRLANSLGLAELGNEPQLVDAARFADLGLSVDGELWAMMLDAKRTWDELVERNASSDAARDAVLQNRIYQQLSNAVAGSTEYMATEKLYELYQEDRYDILILDTPPTRNALDFLDAPQRLSRFIDSRSLKFFLAPGRVGLRVLGRGGGVVFRVLKRITGVDLLHDLSEFFQSFGDMADGIRERAERVADVLASGETAFLIVTAPQRDAIDEACFFRRRLREGGMPFAGAIVNRVHAQEALDETPEELDADLRALLGDRLGHKVASNFIEYRELAARDAAQIARLRSELKKEPILLIPHLEDDVHDIAGLAAMNEHLFAADTVTA
jgi:anion-transporting  ArsA/GET3 family ATPase